MNVTRLKAGDVDILYNLYFGIEGGANKWGTWKNELKLTGATVPVNERGVNYPY